MSVEQFQSNIPELPDDPREAVRILEDNLTNEQARLDSSAPDPLAPVSTLIAYALAQSRLRADSEVIRVIIEQVDPQHKIAS